MRLADGHLEKLEEGLLLLLGLSLFILFDRKLADVISNDSFKKRGAGRIDQSL
jgi:hypothetical protein